MLNMGKEKIFIHSIAGSLFFPLAFWEVRSLAERYILLLDIHMLSNLNWSHSSFYPVAHYVGYSCMKWFVYVYVLQVFSLSCVVGLPALLRKSILKRFKSDDESPQKKILWGIHKNLSGCFFFKQCTCLIFKLG